ncbi:acetyltransferase [Jeotgalibacillus marinus]|uniref:Acetyltransferase n=1 Tax=Jeotgalibacillus marinus TaxID=86667 RepID=A0ABV3Q147_9BACL
MDIVIVGNGGHSKVIQDLVSTLQAFEIKAILDDSFSERIIEHNIIYDSISSLPSLYEKRVKVVMAIGNNERRKQVVEKLCLPKDAYISLIHPSSVVSKSAVIGVGTVIMPNVVINADAVIGDHAIINTGAIVEHDNVLNDYSHLSPNATLTGNVTLGEGVHIGAGATIIPGIDVGEWSVVGAGAVVIQSILTYQKAVGCPAKVINSTRAIEQI